MWPPLLSISDLFERLDPDQVPVVIHIPDSDGIRGIVDPGPAVVGVWLRQHVLRPFFGFWIEAHETPGLQPAGPDLAILIRHGFIKCIVRNGRIIFADVSRPRVHFDEHPATAAIPRIPVRIKGPSGAAGYIICFEFPHLTGLGVQQTDQMRANRGA